MESKRDSSACIHDLGSLECRNTQDFGGKAANLQILQENGFNIPNGFVLPCDFYSRHLHNDPTVSQLIHRLESTDDIDELMQITEDIGKLMGSCDISEEIYSEVESAFLRLKNELGDKSHGFAVRSSATLEDGSHFSFAGQAESYLGATNLQEVLYSIKRVWCSALNARTLFYLNSKDIPLSKVRMAVIVQQLIPADVSGVMFTANVVTNNRKEMLIDMAYGLGGAIVSGKVIPDNYIIKKNPLVIVERSLGKKERIIIPDFSGEKLVIKEEKTPPELKRSFALSEEQVLSVARLGQRIEEVFGYPQDIEWCMYDDELVVLQSRPITTLR